MTRATALKATLAAAVAIGGTLGHAAVASAANNATTTASARIVQAIAIVKNTDLAFGQIVAGSTASKVTVAASAAGTRSFGTARASGGAYNGGTSGTTDTAISSAKFTVTGYDNTAFSITLPSSVTLNSGSNTMTVNNLLHDAGSSPALASGTKVFYVGADLNVGANQATGAYSNTFDVTVDYQ